MGAPLCGAITEEVEGKLRQPDLMFSQTLQSHSGPREKPQSPALRKRVGWELNPSSLGWMGGGDGGRRENKVNSPEGIWVDLGHNHNPRGSH